MANPEQINMDCVTPAASAAPAEMLSEEGDDGPSLDNWQRLGDIAAVLVSRALSRTPGDQS